MFDNLEKRMVNFSPEVKIADIWISLESLVDARVMFDRETYVKEFREEYGNAVGNWLELNMPA